jgi:microcystin-dependent protein
LGTKSGSEEETIATNTLPSHTHRMTANTQAGQEQSPVGALPAQSSSDVYVDNAPAPSLVALHTDSVTKLGGSQSHTNLQPFLCVHFIIALFGVYPSR